MLRSMRETILQLKFYREPQDAHSFGITVVLTAQRVPGFQWNGFTYGFSLRLKEKIVKSASGATQKQLGLFVIEGGPESSNRCQMTPDRGQ